MKVQFKTIQFNNQTFASKYEKLSDKQLVQLIQNPSTLKNNQSRIWTILYNKHQDTVQNQLLKSYSTISKHDIEDACAEAFIKVYSKIIEKKYTNDNFAGYLFTIAKNILLDKLKESNNKTVSFTELEQQGNRNTKLSPVVESFTDIDNIKPSIEQLQARYETIYKKIHIDPKTRTYLHNTSQTSLKINLKIIELKWGDKLTNIRIRDQLNYLFPLSENPKFKNNRNLLTEQAIKNRCFNIKKILHNDIAGNPSKYSSLLKILQS